MTRIFISAMLVLVLGCSQNTLVKNQNAGAALGTGYSIIYITEDKFDFQKEIDSVFHGINQSMSTYIPDSDISKINNGDSTVVIDEMFKEVFEISKSVHKVSKGYFDPTVGVLVNAWGFGPEKQIALDSVKVDSLLRYVGWDKVNLNADQTISKNTKNIRFDFNAVAKGYAIDRLGKLLDGKKVDNYLIEVGGEVLTKGTNLISKKEWTVGIDDPQMEEQRTLKKIIKLRNRAMASSGNYRKFRIDPKTKQKYVHTIDPKTGFTKNSNVLATTVLAEDCATADAYATAFMAMNLEDSMAVLDSLKQLDAYIIYLDENNQTKEHLTKGFEALVIK